MCPARRRCFEVLSKAPHKGEVSGGRDGSDAFQRVPNNAEMFEPLTANSNVQAFRLGVRHSMRINDWEVRVEVVV